jgi:hypothetical protein
MVGCIAEWLVKEEMMVVTEWSVRFCGWGVSQWSRHKPLLGKVEMGGVGVQVRM